MIEVAVDRHGVSSAISKGASHRWRFGWPARRITKTGCVQFAEGRLHSRRVVVPRVDLCFRGASVGIGVTEPGVRSPIRTGRVFRIKTAVVFPIRIGTVMLRRCVLVIGTAANGDSLGQMKLIAGTGLSV
jgi:hypothetical protein